MRRGFLKGSIVAFALLIPVLAYNVWDYVETRRLNAVIETLVRNGESISEPYRILSALEKEADRTYRGSGARRGRRRRHADRVLLSSQQGRARSGLAA